MELNRFARFRKMKVPERIKVENEEDQQIADMFNKLLSFEVQKMIRESLISEIPFELDKENKKSP